MAWKSDSPVWEAIAQLTAQGLTVPSCGDVSISPMPKIKIENGTARPLLQDNGSVSPNNYNNNIQSPLPSSASERFQSPVTSTYLAKKPVYSPRNIKPGQSLLQNSTSKFFLSIGGEKLIPVMIQSKQQNPTTALVVPESMPDLQSIERKAKRGGSLGLFFRKVS